MCEHAADSTDTQTSVHPREPLAVQMLGYTPRAWSILLALESIALHTRLDEVDGVNDDPRENA